MSTLIGALDANNMQKKLYSNTASATHSASASLSQFPTQTQKKYGENIHPEYTWSSEIKENILQLYFQITQSTDKRSIDKLKLIYRNLIENILDDPQTVDSSTITEKDRRIAAITIYKLIGQTRDIVSGKGLYNISYVMIAEWARYSIVGPPKYKKMCEHLASEAITSFVHIDSEKQPYGSWKDMKYFCNCWNEVERELLTSHSARKKPHNIMNTVFDLICNQLRKDEAELTQNPETNNLSLLARWIPREKSNKFGWITNHIAYKYYAHYLTDVIGKPNEMAARKKCLTHFRMTISKLNKALKTPQINQCAQNWKNIDFDKNVTSITLRKQSLAFQNVTKKNTPRDNKTREAHTDRLECAENYKSFAQRCVENKSTAKGANVSMADFVRSAVDLLNNTSNIPNAPNSIERCMINSQWANSTLNTKSLANILAMCDTSGSMEVDNSNPLYSAIAMSIRVAEKSALGKRIMTFSATPEWINLEESQDFVSSVNLVKQASWGMNTNFYAALKLVLDTAIEKNMEPSLMENMILVIFSDMQIDHASNENLDTMFESMKKLYADAGLKTIHKKPYNVPHILFWNLRTTDGFPCISSTKNTSMMSGSSPALLNLFYEKGMDALKECTPWNMMQESLSNMRYNILELAMKESWSLV